jgi:LPXTG-motif cell wall-anchored protein
VNKQGLILMVCILFFFGISPMNTNAKENEDKIEISLFLPSNDMFDVKNMRPGYGITKTLIIQNSGNVNYDYYMDAHKQSGSDKLFNQLLLSVTTENGELIFKGKLSKFQNIGLRHLDKSRKEKLIFQIELPPEIGNEYQALQTKVIYFFIAKYSLNNNSGGVLPRTGETNPWLFYISGILITLIGVTRLFLKTSIFKREQK